MAIYTLSRTQIINAGLPQCWAFFSDPRNLQRITPPSLDFRILSDLPPAVYPGMMIQYRVRPLFGIPVTWLTEITQVDAPHSFVDEQRVGPYRLWHHEHTFRQMGERQVEIGDKVHYAMPFGVFGSAAHALFVRGELEKIFAYREKVVTQIFSETSLVQAAGIESSRGTARGRP
jgi:ligand-binding SRPBCC domain-containing protein